MKISFRPPLIVGALCEGGREIPRELARRMKALSPRIAFLPFIVERRHLRNTAACMQLMDVRSLFVAGRLAREIGAHLPSLGKNARAAGEADVVVRRGRRFVGDSALRRAIERGLAGLALGRRGKTGLLVGHDPLADMVASCLRQKGWIIGKLGCKPGCQATAPAVVIIASGGTKPATATARIRHLGPATAVIDLRQRKPSSRTHARKRLTRRKLLGLFYQIAVELLTRG